MDKPQLSSVRINYYYRSGRHFKTSTSNIRIYLPYCLWYSNLKSSGEASKRAAST